MLDLTYQLLTDIKKNETSKLQMSFKWFSQLIENTLYLFQDIDLPGDLFFFSFWHSNGYQVSIGNEPVMIEFGNIFQMTGPSSYSMVIIGFLYQEPEIWFFSCGDLMISLLLTWTDCRTSCWVANDFRHHDIHVTSLQWGHNDLTHLPLVSHIYISESDQHWFR